MKKNLIFVLIFAVIFSAASITIMISRSNNASLQNISSSLKCVTQGDWQPESFGTQNDSPVELNDQLCKNFENEKSKKN